jgi:hypothetical protein
MKTVTGSRRTKRFANILFSILAGMAIGTLATFILKFMGGGIKF